MKQGLYQRLGKRALDLSLSLPALAVTAPLMAGIAIALRFDVGAPVIFRQQRPGKDGQPFTILKFRTMTDAINEAGELLPDAERLTALGQIVRRLSLDELPQLLSVVRGEMSLIGPRPLLMEYLERYTSEQSRRHEVKPGITGWTQVNGRNTLSWPEKFALDVFYVDHLSLRLDLKILILTAQKVLTHDDISADGHSTMPKFQGTPVEPSSAVGTT